LRERGRESAKEREKEREHKQEGKREREGESQANSVLSTEPSVGLNLMTLGSRPELKPRVGCLTD